VPWTRPKLSDLSKQARTVLSGGLGIGPLLDRSVLAVWAKVVSGFTHGLHGHLDWNARQLLPDTAEGTYLERHASLSGLQRKPATFASGAVRFTGVDGTAIPNRRRLRRTDGAEFETRARVTIAGGSATVSVVALASGTGGNCPVGTALALTSPIAGISSAGFVQDPGMVDGLDAELDEDLRARVLQDRREPPAGGSSADYVRWATEVAGVTRAWCFPLFNGYPGVVGVAFVTDEASTGMIPTASKVAEVGAYIDARRPVGANVIVFAPEALVVNFAIQVEPNTTTVQEAVEAELEDMLRRTAAPGERLYLNRIHEAISGAAGETNHVLAFPLADVVPASGQIVVMGTVGFL